MTDATQLIPSVFVTVAVALAALILTSASYTRQPFTEQIELQRRHSDSQFAQLREEVREIRGEIQEIRREVREVRGEVGALAERQAKVEGLLLAVHPPKLVSPPSGAPGTGSSASRTEAGRSPGERLLAFNPIDRRASPVNQSPTARRRPAAARPKRWDAEPPERSRAKRGA